MFHHSPSSIVRGLLLAVSLSTLAACGGSEADGLEPPDEALPETEDDAPVTDNTACDAAASLGELDLLSCRNGAPVSADGRVAVGTGEMEGEVSAQSCTTYYGTCTGIGGCSRAVGGGWQFTVCGPFLYAWMTVCDGQPRGWGGGVCLW
ncbi:hypothetical protein HPC49_23425 [Pyxidicoccus fallax]|uniref:Lipoprotein n=1 Tax=Pyxidicoccus fallax TaxID=394095 RepID=A0A848LD53_9BACT|nr:hypothetical protein [Pyxidicoccus fallax]NMO16929.1 hypothetical protein [Pyxidicoccus fallax]NPC81166.1 hypothetical protein [Pyxidicoccus fallax]